MGFHHRFIPANQPQNGDTFRGRERQIMTGTVNVVAVNFFPQARAIRETTLKDGREVIPPDIALKTQGFRPFSQPEALEIPEEIVVIGIAVVAGGSAG